MDSLYSLTNWLNTDTARAMKIKSDLFNCGRICKYCGVNMDTIDLEGLKFLHATCWQEYRKDGELYPFPKNL